MAVQQRSLPHSALYLATARRPRERLSQASVVSGRVELVLVGSWFRQANNPLPMPLARSSNNTKAENSISLIQFKI